MQFLQRVEKLCKQVRHAVRLLKKMQNFVFCEWELYDGTAPEQKTKSTKNPENSMFSGFLHLIHRKRSPFC